LVCQKYIGARAFSADRDDVSFYTGYGYELQPRSSADINNDLMWLWFYDRRNGVVEMVKVILKL
jgi:hypothetical protein